MRSTCTRRARRAVWDRYEEIFYACVELHIHIPALATSFDTRTPSAHAQGERKRFNPQRYNLHFHTLSVLIMWLPSLSLHIHHAVVPFSARGGSPFQLIKSDPYPSIVQRGKRRRGETERLISVSKQTVLEIMLIISSQNNEAREVLWQGMNVPPPKKNYHQLWCKACCSLCFWSHGSIVAKLTRRGRLNVS